MINDDGAIDDMWMLPPLSLMGAGVDWFVSDAPDDPTGPGYWATWFTISSVGNSWRPGFAPPLFLSKASDHLARCQNASEHIPRPAPSAIYDKFAATCQAVFEFATDEGFLRVLVSQPPIPNNHSAKFSAYGVCEEGLFLPVGASHQQTPLTFKCL